MPSASRLTVSTLIGPSTIEKISVSTSSNGRPAAAIWVGFVVTPSRIPQEAAFRISSTFAVSRKSCIPLSITSDILGSRQNEEDRDPQQSDDTCLQQHQRAHPRRQAGRKFPPHGGLPFRPAGNQQIARSRGSEPAGGRRPDPDSIAQRCVSPEADAWRNRRPL